MSETATVVVGKEDEAAEPSLEERASKLYAELAKLLASDDEKDHVEALTKLLQAVKAPNPFAQQ